MSAVVTGAKGVVKFNSLPVAWISGVSVEHRIQLDEIPQLDTMEVAEYAESGIRVSLTLTLFKGRRFGAFTFGLDPQRPDELITREESTIELFDGTTGEPVYVAEGCKFAGGGGQVDARGLWVGRWEFRCRRGRGI